MRNRRLLSELAGLAVFAAMLSGCVSAPAPVPSPSPLSSTSALGKLGPGDCLGALDGASFDLDAVQASSCTSPHNWEVSEIVPLTGEQYPGEIDLKQQADTGCAAAFTSYLGAQPGYSSYSASYLVPDEAAWADQTSRRVVCLVGLPADQLSASIKGDTKLFPRIGECTQTQSGDENLPKVVNCSTAHAYEAYAEKELTGKAAPTTAESDKLYTEVCVAAFTKFVGIDVGRSKYEITAFVAPADSWTKIADHRIVCSVGDPSGGITGSLKGVKQ